MLGVGLDELIGDTIKGMQEVAEAIGLKGIQDKVGGVYQADPRNSDPDDWVRETPKGHDS